MGQAHKRSSETTTRRDRRTHTQTHVHMHTSTRYYSSVTHCTVALTLSRVLQYAPAQSLPVTQTEAPQERNEATCA